MGEENYKPKSTDFSCERMIDGEIRNVNLDIEHFIKVNAIQFARLWVTPKMVRFLAILQ